MLVLKRRPGEILHIGPDITIRFMDFHGGQMQIGIEAPKNVHILRGELRKRAEAKQP